MSVDSALAAGRAAAEALRTDTCVITRPSDGQPTFDPATGVSTPQAATPVYTGPCRVRSTGSPGTTLSEQDNEAGGHGYTVQEFVLSLPMDVRPHIDDLVQVTASPYDPTLLGRQFIVGPSSAGSLATARRVVIREVTS